MNWNVLTDSWLDVMNLDAKPTTCSPLEALRRASDILCITAGSPLDLFAAHRFLLTLLYWKADAAGGVAAVRETLLKGKAPLTVLKAVADETGSFELLDANRPFLQDPTVRDKDDRSVGYLLTEVPCKSNIAHFFHGSDSEMKFCPSCVAKGMLRLVPWGQTRGRGHPNAVHGGPPIMALVAGRTLGLTLAMNLIPLSCPRGEAKWSGTLRPTAPITPIPLLEALTWNARRVHLRNPATHGFCWYCGKTGLLVGPISYEMNPHVRARKATNGRESIPFQWADPAAFYLSERPYRPVSSSREDDAATSKDLLPFTGEPSPSAAVVRDRLGEPLGWCLVVPCTNRAKTFDHRAVSLPALTKEAIRAAVPPAAELPSPRELPGWEVPEPKTATPSPRARGAAVFLQTAVDHFSAGDWAAFADAGYRQMHEAPCAFDLFSGLWWALRERVQLPSKHVGWLMLKVMAVAPADARVLTREGAFNPIRRAKDEDGDLKLAIPFCANPKPKKTPSVDALWLYPRSLPQGQELEETLKAVILANLKKQQAMPVDWVGLCDGLNQLLD